MKVLYILGFLPPYVKREINALSAQGVDVSVFLPAKQESSTPADFWSSISGNGKSESAAVERVLDFRLLTCPVSQLFVPLLKSLRFMKQFLFSLKNGEFRYFLIASATVSKIKSTGRPDIIHAHFALDNAHVARIMAGILKVPYTVTTHATDIFVPPSLSRLQRVLRQAAQVFTISRYNIDYLVKYGPGRENVTVLKLGLNTSELPERKHPPEIPLAVCTASGLVPKKGVPVLIGAMRILKQRSVNCRLTVIGSDPDGTTLKKYREETTDLPVEFAGLLNSQRTLETVSAATFFVLPCVEAENGDKDGIPVALMEAMGMGIPCISTDISGIPELIENKVSGILVKPGSSEELADAMNKLISNSETAASLGAEGRKKVVTEHSPEEQAGILLESFRKTLTERKQI